MAATGFWGRAFPFFPAHGSGRDRRSRQENRFPAACGKNGKNPPHLQLPVFCRGSSARISRLSCVCGWVPLRQRGEEPALPGRAGKRQEFSGRHFPAVCAPGEALWCIRTAVLNRRPPLLPCAISCRFPPFSGRAEKRPLPCSSEKTGRQWEEMRKGSWSGRWKTAPLLFPRLWQGR